jgi:hypothetical protein
MPAATERPPTDAAAGRCHPARWAEPRPGPGLLGLAVAALVGGTAAASWTLSTWLAYHESDLRRSGANATDACPADLARAAPYRSPAASCQIATAEAVGELPKIIEGRRDGIALYFVDY